MSNTIHLHRLLVIIPASSQASFNTWCINNLNEGGLAFTVGLNATGLAADPITHYWNCRAYTNAELKLIVNRLCVLSGLTLPANWDTRTRAQKKAIVASNLDTIKTQVGIADIRFDDNDGVWSSYSAALAATGLKTIAPIL